MNRYRWTNLTFLQRVKERKLCPIFESLSLSPEGGMLLEIICQWDLSRQLIHWLIPLSDLKGLMGVPTERPFYAVGPLIVQSKPII